MKPPTEPTPSQRDRSLSSNWPQGGVPYLAKVRNEASSDLCIYIYIYVCVFYIYIYICYKYHL